MKSGLVVEDLPEAQLWLSDVLSLAFPGISIQIAASIKQAQARLAGYTPDVALLDLNLPDGDGSSLIPGIKARAPDAVVVITTIYGDDEHLYPALRAGADGYLLKEEGKDKLVAALLSIGSGDPPLSPQIAQRLIRFFREGAPDQSQSLTAREQEVLVLIAKGYTLTEVSTHFGLSRNTVATHVKRIYTKLHISSRAEATLEAARRGIISTKL
jgi:DNA-binding NarL/FixJ family response regulator